MNFLCTLKNALPIIRNRFGLSFATKGLSYLAALYLPLPFLAHYKLSCYQTTLLLTISALANITLLKTTCHFLLLLVGFDTLTYQKELQLIPYTCGSSLPLSVYEGTWTHSPPLVAMHLLDRSCVIVGKFWNCMLRFPTVSLCGAPYLCIYRWGGGGGSP